MLAHILKIVVAIFVAAELFFVYTLMKAASIADEEENFWEEFWNKK